MKVSKNFIFLCLILTFLIFSCLTKDITAPEVNYIQNNLVISPDSDGVQDELVLDLNIKEEGYIKYWRLDVYNEKDEVVKTFSSGENLEELKKKSIFKKENIEVPEKLQWDGTDNDGNKLPDGKYTFKFVTMDNKKNVTPENTTRGTIILDTEDPEMDIKIDESIYSPNDDGNKDILEIEVDIIKNLVQAVSTTGIGKKDKEEKKGQMWYVDILNENGDLIKRYEYSDKGKKNIEWDFKDAEGNKIPDGKYTIKLHSIDEGGNAWEKIVKEIIIDTKPTPVEIKATDLYFSPNADNVKDTIGLELNIPIKNGIEKWEIKILNTANEISRVLTGDGVPGSAQIWDGKNDEGAVVKEDKYKAVLTVTYANGNKPTNQSGDFMIDLTIPNAKITLSPEIFSPDGNGKQDTAIILQNTSMEKEWKGYFTNQKGKVVKTYIWMGEAPKKVEWDGLDDSNTLNEDGFYYYQLVSTDEAGNTYKSEKYKTKIYTKDTPIFITASLGFFSPNDDGIIDTQSFAITSNVSTENTVAKWEMSIKNDKSKVIYTVKKDGKLPKSIEWNGKDNAGKIADDGGYTAVLNVNFKAGTESQSFSKVFKIDTTPPEIEITTTPQYFSPDADGFNDELAINIKSTDESGVKNWKIVAYKPGSEREFHSWKGVGNPIASIMWDGKNADGDQVESVEDYPVKIFAEDNAGNKMSKDSDPIMIDILVIKIDENRYKIRISNIRFKPNRAEMTNDPKNKEILDKLVRALRKYRQYNIRIEGHANRFAKGLDNNKAKDLSKRRALTVAKEMKKRGIKQERLYTLGKGFDEPLVPLKDKMTEEEKEDMARNRRVEFYLIRTK